MALDRKMKRQTRRQRRRGGMQNFTESIESTIRQGYQEGLTWPELYEKLVSEYQDVFPDIANPGVQAHMYEIYYALRRPMSRRNRTVCMNRNRPRV